MGADHSSLGIGLEWFESPPSPHKGVRSSPSRKPQAAGEVGEELSAPLTPSEESTPTHAGTDADILDKGESQISLKSQRAEADEGITPLTVNVSSWPHQSEEQAKLAIAHALKRLRTEAFNSAAAATAAAASVAAGIDRGDVAAMKSLQEKLDSIAQLAGKSILLAAEELAEIHDKHLKQIKTQDSAASFRDACVGEDGVMLYGTTNLEQKEIPTPTTPRGANDYLAVHEAEGESCPTTIRRDTPDTLGQRLRHAEMCKLQERLHNESALRVAAESAAAAASEEAKVLSVKLEEMKVRCEEMQRAVRHVESVQCKTANVQSKFSLLSDLWSPSNILSPITQPGNDVGSVLSPISGPVAQSLNSATLLMDKRAEKCDAIVREECGIPQRTRRTTRAKTNRTQLAASKDVAPLRPVSARTRNGLRA
mmetsp:Transcript_16665/g.46304  ORF Transcript_16665/g.46304 Transcript_16665/m.46304 type:complete len:424 (+) Transcript_16665:46-1317(+)